MELGLPVYFEAWLKENASKFRNPPLPVKKYNGLHLYRFEGLTKQLILRAGKNGIEVAAQLDNEILDFIADFPGSYEYTGGVYRCAECGLESAGPAEFFANHNFIPLLEWTLTELDPGYWLAFFISEGCTEARIISLKQKMIKRPGLRAVYFPLRRQISCKNGPF